MKKKYNNITIILPANNEQSAIEKTISRIFGVAVVRPPLVINDGSTDHTATRARAAGAKVITHPYAMGNGAAIKTGARAADSEILIFMDADGQHDPADVPRLLEALDEGYDMVVGARQKGSQANRGRGLANAFYNRLASYITGHKVEDLTSGFRAVRADKFREFLYLLPNGFSYPTTITMAFFRAGYTVRYVPIHAAKRVGKSHIKPLQDGLRFLLIIFRIGTLYSPLKIFVPIATLQGLVGLSYYAYTFLTMGRLTGGTVFLLTSALTIFLIGLVSEQITQLMYKDSGTGGHRNTPAGEDGPRT